MSTVSLEERLDFTLELAKKAGDTIRRFREEASFNKNLKRGVELVTDADIAVDTLINGALSSHFPNDGRLTEELSPDLSDVNPNDALWIVDPIDGTVNFAHGHHHVAVSIAWAINGEIQLGVVHAPFLNETYSAIRGKGAWLNDQPIKVSGETDLNASLVATGFSYSREERFAQLKLLSQVLPYCQDIRRIGSAALDICAVASGRMEAFYETVNPWDFAAGHLIASEAGAFTGHFSTKPAHIPEELYGKDLVVCTPGITNDLMRRLQGE